MMTIDVKKGTEIEKKVRFNLDETDIENDNPFVEIKVQVDTVVETVLGMQEEEDDGKHRIDDFYIHFPSSQTRFTKHLEDLDNKMKMKEKEAYKVDTEDISDPEEENKTMKNDEVMKTSEEKLQEEKSDKKKEEIDNQEKVENENVDTVDNTVKDSAKDGIDVKTVKNDGDKEMDENICKKDEPTPDSKTSGDGEEGNDNETAELVYLER